jgi:SAM-dependent methyltransferase
MSTTYALAYRLGITPWESAAEGGREQFEGLLDKIGQVAGRPGKALDLGCGRGLHSVNLAQRGWQVTGVDMIGRALDGARKRAQEAGVHVDLVQGDVTALPPAVGSGYDFVLDIGCFHGLKDEERVRYGREVERVTSPGAQLLILAFRPGGRGPLPRGADGAQINAVLPGWHLTEAEAAETTGMPKPLHARVPYFYRLVKS